MKMDAPLAQSSGGYSDNAVCLFTAAAGLLIAGFADNQLDAFMRENQRRIAAGRPKQWLLESGLWRYSRHPNYFGEQLFWWAIAGLGVVCGEAWVIVGTAYNSIILATVTVMTERRMMAIPERTEAFRAYRARTSVWIPWWNRSPQA